MDSQEYAIARLDDEQLDELKQLEQQWIDRSGHAVTIIAYEKRNGLAIPFPFLR